MMTSIEISPAWPAFPTRLMALPAVNDACGLAAHLYQRSKGYSQVGAALGVAENSLKTAVTKAAPLAEPLLRYAGHLKPLDEWACRRLDDVERMMPVVTKPSSEILRATREGVLCTLAGKSDPPASLSAAVRSRAARLVEQTQAIKERTVAAGIVPHRALDAAHDLLDHYLPEEKKDPNEPDVREGGVCVKTFALATRTSRGVCRAAHERLHASCPLDPTPSHVAMECVHLVRYRWQRGAGEEVKQLEMPQVVAPVLVLALRLTGAFLHLLLTVMIILVGKVNAACLKMSQKCDGKRVSPLTEDEKIAASNGQREKFT